jgi:hypothetical protein
MKLAHLVAAAALAASGFLTAPVPEAKAETRFHLMLPGFPPPPRRHYYYYPDPYEDEYGYYDEEEDDDYEGYYYYEPEEEYYPPPPRQYAPNPKKKTKTVTTPPPAKTVTAPPAKVEPPPVPIKRKPQTATAAAATPAKPTAEAKSTGVSCDKAKSIITGYGFGNIETKSCEGDVYSFAAVRGGKTFSVKVSALNGELTEVKRQ